MARRAPRPRVTKVKDNCPRNTFDEDENCVLDPINLDCLIDGRYFKTTDGWCYDITDLAKWTVDNPTDPLSRRPFAQGTARKLIRAARSRPLRGRPLYQGEQSRTPAQIAHELAQAAHNAALRTMAQQQQAEARRHGITIEGNPNWQFDYLDLVMGRRRQEDQRLQRQQRQQVQRLQRQQRQTFTARERYIDALGYLIRKVLRARQVISEAGANMPFSEIPAGREKEYILITVIHEILMFMSDDGNHVLHRIPIPTEEAADALVSIILNFPEITLDRIIRISQQYRRDPTDNRYEFLFYAVGYMLEHPAEHPWIARMLATN